MKLNKHRFVAPARIELLPLIDVIFLLLILFIFIMLTVSVQKSISIDIPKLGENEQQANDVLTIKIDAQNELYINNHHTDQALLMDHVITLQSIYRIPILIRGDQESNLGTALQILDNLRAAGYNEVAFSVQPTTQSIQ
ncbi:biopolymer transporter ExbD [Psychromonas sp.]|nr:biopolymer transporter ExbD [Psychromonas sp.]